MYDTLDFWHCCSHTLKASPFPAGACTHWPLVKLHEYSGAGVGGGCGDDDDGWDEGWVHEASHTA
jgi:hypothetical protein